MNNANNIEELARRVKEKKPKRVLLQLPEGLKTSAVNIAEAIEKKGIDVILSADPCYGACDLPIAYVAKIDADLIVHVGHNKFYKCIEENIPVLYYPWEISAEISNIDFSVIKEKKIGLLTSIQHLSALERVSSLLKNTGKEPIKGGQILGCWTENAERIRNRVDAFLFIGSGMFHSLAIKDKKIYMLDLEKRQVIEVDTAKMEKKRFANIYKCRDAKTFAILVSSKPGQFDLELAENVKNDLEKKDKKAFMLIMNEITNEKLMAIDVDAFINTACPRLVDEHFSKPIINTEDVEEVLK